MSQFKSKKFLDLKDEWYKKLSSEGFEDIEANEDNLKVWSTYYTAKHRYVTREAKEEYYREAGTFLHEYEFSSELERQIWELHAEGLSLREIVAKLSKTGIKTYKFRVETIVSKLAEIVVRRCLMRST